MARYVVKLGSSIVAEDSGALRPAVLARVCDQVAARHAAGDDVVVVTSGAIARGIQLMGLSPRPTAIEDLQAASAVGQGKLYRVYDELLRERGVTSAQVLLTFFDMSARTHYLNARQTLRRLLDWSVVPVINENDTTTTDEISFGDNDFLAAQVAILIGADLLVLLTDIDGLFTADPRTDASAAAGRGGRRLRAPREPSTSATRTSPLGSGGMRSKVVAAEMATAAGIPAVICSGLDDAALGTVLDGGAAGTRFPAQQARYSSFKLWLRYAKPSHGTVVIDAGAARALREGGTSLLPVGIVEVRGGFDAGDAVHVAEGAAVIGKGISNYSADRAAPGHGPEERPGARGPAAGHGRGRAPRLLRLGVIGRWPPPPHRSRSTAARSPSCAWPPATPRGRSPRCPPAPRTPRCTRSPMRSRRGRRRSSRPTRATWRRAARTGSTPRCSIAWRSTRGA